jgi:hypothetical protein
MEKPAWWYVDIYLPDNMAAHPRWPQASYSLLWGPQSHEAYFRFTYNFILFIANIYRTLLLSLLYLKALILHDTKKTVHYIHTLNVPHSYKTLKVKGKVVSVHVMKACRGNRSTAPLILNLSTRCRYIVSLAIWPFHPWYPLNEMLGGLHSPSECFGEQQKSHCTCQQSSPSL